MHMFSLQLPHFLLYACCWFFGIKALGVYHRIPCLKESGSSELSKSAGELHTVDGRNPAPPGMYKTL